MSVVTFAISSLFVGTVLPRCLRREHEAMPSFLYHLCLHCIPALSFPQRMSLQKCLCMCSLSKHPQNWLLCVICALTKAEKCESSKKKKTLGGMENWKSSSLFGLLEIRNIHSCFHGYSLAAYTAVDLFQFFILLKQTQTTQRALKREGRHCKPFCRVKQNYCSNFRRWETVWKLSPMFMRNLSPTNQQSS